MGNNTRLGMFALHGSELCVVAPFKYHSVGISCLISLHPRVMVFADVFSWNSKGIKLLLDLDFTIHGVKEKYCKKKDGWESVIILSKL